MIFYIFQEKHPIQSRVLNEKSKAKSTNTPYLNFGVKHRK